MNQIVSYDEEWAKRALAAAENEKLQDGTFLSTRGGMLSFGEEEMPGNQACVIVLDSVRENTFYPEKFDVNQRKEDAKPPICYAFARDADETMGPHPTMQADLTFFDPQSATCGACPHNEYGSADTGRGKACQNRRRLALVPAGVYSPIRGSRDFNLDLYTEPKHYQSADIAYLKLSPTSVKNWSKYVQLLSSTMHRPPEAVVTRLWIEPHTKHQFHVCFEPVDQVPNELALIIMARAEEAKKNIIQGYAPPGARDATTDQAPAGSLRGLRRSR